MTPPEWRRLLRRRSVTDTATRPSQFHGCDKRWYLYRRGSVYSAGSISSQRLSRPPSNRRPALLVSWTDPFDSPLNSIFMLGGAPKAREVYSKGAPFNNALHYDRLESWFLFLVWEYADCTRIQAGGILTNHRMIRGKMKGTVHLPDAVEVQPR